MSWRQVVGEARHRGFFATDEVDRAENFETCAVGEQRAQYPDVVKYHASQGLLWPVDETLDFAGADFYLAILSTDFDEAERLLDVIEDRALELKRGGVEKP